MYVGVRVCARFPIKMQYMDNLPLYVVIFRFFSFIRPYVRMYLSSFVSIIVYYFTLCFSHLQLPMSQSLLNMEVVLKVYWYVHVYTQLMFTVHHESAKNKTLDHKIHVCEGELTIVLQLTYFMEIYSVSFYKCTLQKVYQFQTNSRNTSRWLSSWTRKVQLHWVLTYSHSDFLRK